MDKPSLHSIKGGRITAEQLLSYRTGTLPQEERLRIEQLMEDDPFLRDAIEGLSFASPEQITQALESINKQVDARTRAATSGGFSANLRKYAAAATILVFLGATLLVMRQLNKTAATEEIALNKSEDTFPAFNNADTTGMGAGDSNVEAEETIAPLANKTITPISANAESLNETEPVTAEYGIADSYETVTAGAVSVTEDAFLSKPTAFDLETIAKKNEVLEANAYRSEEIILADEQKITMAESASATRSDKKVFRSKEKSDRLYDNKDESANEESAPTVGASFDTDDLAMPADSIFIDPETIPEFVGGETALRTFLNANLSIPTGTPDGTIYVKFRVMSDGKISDAYVAKSLSPISDIEVLRVINLMPAWKPGTQNGKAVDVWMTLPIKVGAPTK